MAQMIYNPEALGSFDGHESYRSTLNRICLRDYNKAYFSHEIECTDLDSYEKGRHPDTSGPTVDAIVGIADLKDGTRTVNPRLALVELKIDVRNIANVRPADLKGKVSHSKSLLSPCRTEKRIFLIYNSNVLQQMRNFLYRLAKEDTSMKDYEVHDVCSFESRINITGEIPYKFLHSGQEIQDSFKNATSENFYSTFKYWNNLVETYRNKYNLKEALHIIQSMISIIQCLSPEDEDIGIIASLALEDLRITERGLLASLL